MSLRSVFLACCVLAFAGIPANHACVETIQLTDSDQDEIAETVLVYSQNHPATYLGENGVTSGYLMVRGDDPSSDLLEKLQKDGFAFRPLSEAAHRAGYTISIGAFAPISSGTAQGVLFAYNRGTGGATENYIVRRIDDHWTVDGYQVLEIVLVATPVVYSQ